MALIKSEYYGKTVYHFDKRFFTYQSKTFEIVGSESFGKGVMDVVHRIKSESGEMKDVKMKDILKKLLSDPETEVVER
jgi:hypothetical protein